jgi:hypothetical protein
MKKGKEISIETNKNYNIYSGTVDNKKSKSIYINISSWGQPIQDEEIDYTKIVKNLRKNISQHINKSITDTNFKKDDTIIDLDMRSSGISFNKKSFMSCEITLFQKVYHPVNSDINLNHIKTISNSLIDDVLEKNEYFSFTKLK